MIDLFQFIDKNADGDKERLTGATVQLYNKLSAEETNLIRDKLNEIIAFVNGLNTPRTKHILTFDLISGPQDFEMEEGQVVYLITINDVVYREWVQDGTTLTVDGYAPTGGGFTDIVTVYYEE